MSANQVVAIVLSLAPGVVAPWTQEREGGGNRDSVAALVSHLSSLTPISARGVRSVGFFSPTTDPETVSWTARHYDGSSLEWRRGKNESYSAEYGPEGVPTSRMIFRAGATTTYDFEERSAFREPLYAMRSDLSPDTYFLDVPPIPFSHFLAQAITCEPSAEERSLGAAVSIVVENLGTDYRQRLKLAVSEQPVRILQIDWLYQSGDGGDHLVERYSYDEWSTVNGEPFPLKHTKSSFEGGEIWTTRTLQLEKIGHQQVPDDLDVPTGITYSTPEMNGGAVLVGSVSSEGLAKVLRELRRWASKRPQAEVFIHEDLHFDAAMTALEQSRSDASEVPLNSSVNNYECGPICLSLAIAMQAGDREAFIPVDGLHDLAQNQGGSSLEDVAAAASKAGLHALAIRGDILDLMSYKKPMIFPIKSDPAIETPSHFVLVGGEFEGIPILIDPPSPAFVASMDWLDSYWTGDALLLSVEPITLNGNGHLYWLLSAITIVGVFLALSAHLVRRR